MGTCPACAPSMPCHSDSLRWSLGELEDSGVCSLQLRPMLRDALGRKRLPSGGVKIPARFGVPGASAEVPKECAGTLRTGPEVCLDTLSQQGHPAFPGHPGSVPPRPCFGVWRTLSPAILKAHHHSWRGAPGPCPPQPPRGSGSGAAGTGPAPHSLWYWSSRSKRRLGIIVCIGFYISHIYMHIFGRQIVRNYASVWRFLSKPLAFQVVLVRSADTDPRMTSG